MKRFRPPALLQAALIVTSAYLLLDNAFPPLLPTSLMVQYMLIIISGVLLYFAFDDTRWREFKRPILAVFVEDRLVILRWAMLIVIPALIGYSAYRVFRPAIDPPVELRQVHPAPPSRFKAFGKDYDLRALENPLRKEVIDLLGVDSEQAHTRYQETIGAGRQLYYKNCFYCHGDLLDGAGMYANGLNPKPANFRDVGTIAQLQESYLFWRISTGGPGLPKEGTPWNSAMPVWQEMLSEKEIWEIITFLYDRVGQVPRMWDQQVSQAVTALQHEVMLKREEEWQDPRALYEYHCSVCHGAEGAGDGPAAVFLYPKPRDFTTGLFKDKYSPAEELPTDDDLFNTIKNGLQATAMPAWKSLLSDDQIGALVPTIKRFDLTGVWAPEDATDDEFDDEGHFLGQLLTVTTRESQAGRTPFSPESVKAGHQSFLDNCAQCHGEDGRGNPLASKRLKDDWGNRIWPRDLTKPWTWRITNVQGDTPDARDRTIANIFSRLSIGIPGTPMPAHAGKVRREDRWNIANYVYTLRDYTTQPETSFLIHPRQTSKKLPDSVSDAEWENVYATTLMMIPNIIKEGRLFKPLSNAVSVRTMYNDNEIAFLLELDDRTMSMPGDADAEKTQDKKLVLYPDAFAIQFPKPGSYRLAPVVEKPLFRHGDQNHPTTIWYWNAGSVEPQIDAKATVFDATGVGNALIPRTGTQGVSANGKWFNGRWRVMMKRSRSGGGIDVNFDDASYIPISFANWDGSNGEVDSRHTLTGWYWLVFPKPTNIWTVYGLPVMFFLGSLLAGILLVLSQRGQSIRPKHDNFSTQ